MSDSPILSALLRRWASHAPLSDEDERAILGLPHNVRILSKDAFLVNEGARPSECSLLLSGFAFRQKLVRDGARQIISIHIPSEFVDLQNALLGTADHSVQCLNQCKVATIPRAALVELAGTRPDVGKAMWIDTLVDASIFREWVVNVGRRDSRSRIAHLLCELARRMELSGIGKDGSFEFPLTQEQLADCTGLTAVHMNRTLQALRKEGLISLTSRTLQVLDWEGLRSVGEFDERYLHHEMPVARVA